MTYCVGLTGGIGSGKSTVARMFSELGVTVVDTDTISHQLTGSGGAAIPAIRQAFGDGWLDTSGAMLRAKMRETILSDPTAKQQLESILHPMIRSQAMAEVDASSTPYTLLVVPLLLESGNYADLVQRVLVVDCPESLQISRTRHRSQLDEASIRAIMSYQLPRTRRLQQANDIIVNDSDLADLRLRVFTLHQRYLSVAVGSI